jgi:hypothetical protein
MKPEAPKAAAGTPARMTMKQMTWQVSGVPVKTPPAKRRSDGRPICWHCGNADHLSRDCCLKPGNVVTDNRDRRRDCVTEGLPARRARSRR